MTRVFRLTVLAAATLLAASSPMVAEQTPTTPPIVNRPGYPTTAQVQILNKAPADAVAVKVFNGVEPVATTVLGVPTVALTTGTAIDTRQARQRWDYRHIVTANSADVAAVLNAAGDDGWEAVGSSPTDATHTGWLLKRPR